MYKFIKRFFDILFSSLGILVFLPFFIPLAILLLVTGEHYVFYLQERIGYKKVRFKIWKFATMLKASPGLGTGSITIRNDWRLTPMGKYLRGSKVNEIPQLLNIFLGDMTIIGPRPLMKVDFDKFTLEVQDYFYNEKPGLTGIASIVFCDEEKFHSETNMDPHEFDKKFIAPYKGALELWYQNNISFKTDFLILFLTLGVIVFPHKDLAHKVFKGLPPQPDFVTQTD
jgi:lipopolysaccharide/colanic/teichoic acid biosynthesis glycosyltransferase